MKVITTLFFLLAMNSVIAGKVTSRISSIDQSLKQGDDHLIMLENGNVVFLNHRDLASLRKFKKLFKSQRLLHIHIDDSHNFLSVRVVPGTEKETILGPAVAPLAAPYEPSIVTRTEASKIFKRMRKDYQNNSQCYNRAHIWTWEEFQNSGLLASKHFLFFTRRYIREYRYKWWFHVSPSVKVKGIGDRILDRRYTGGPRSLDAWTKNFIYSGKHCPVVNNYDDYRNNQDSEDCYLIPVSMYFWQPRDILRRDRTGFEKTSFISREVNYAYWEAF